MEDKHLSPLTSLQPFITSLGLWVFSEQHNPMSVGVVLQRLCDCVCETVWLCVSEWVSEWVWVFAPGLRCCSLLHGAARSDGCQEVHETKSRLIQPCHRRFLPLSPPPPTPARTAQPPPPHPTYRQRGYTTTQRNNNNNNTAKTAANLLHHWLSSLPLSNAKANSPPSN